MVDSGRRSSPRVLMAVGLLAATLIASLGLSFAVDAAAEERHHRPGRCRRTPAVGDAPSEPEPRRRATRYRRRHRRHRHRQPAAPVPPSAEPPIPTPDRTRLRRREPSHRIRPPLSRSRYRSPLPNRMCPIRACRPPIYRTMPSTPRNVRSQPPAGIAALPPDRPRSSRSGALNSPPPAPKPPTQRRAINDTAREPGPAALTARSRGHAEVMDRIAIIDAESQRFADVLRRPIRPRAAPPARTGPPPTCCGT